MSERVPAHSLEAEEAVLGACMVDRDAAAAVIPTLDPTQFYAHVHATIFAVIAELYAARKPHDKIAVAERLRARNELDNAGGVAYLTRLVTNSLDTVSTAEYHAQIIREKATLYRLLQAAHKIADIALDGEDDPAMAIAQAEKTLSAAIGDFGVAQSGGHISDLLRGVLAEIDAASQGKLIAQKSPWPQLDLMTGGWFGGEMVAWFGAPKCGKSSAIAQVMQFAAEAYGPVVLFALEMGEDSVVRRLLGNRANISSRRLRSGKLVGTDWDRLGDAVNDLSTMPMFIYSQARSIAQMRRTLLKLRAKMPVKAFIVDHIAFVSDVLNRGKSQTEHDALNQAYLRILELCKEIDCVAHVVTHANRQGYDREPTIKDIRGGGNLEAHAHTIIAPYRENPDEDPRSGKFLVVANREGETGAIPMAFDGPRNTWSQVGGKAA